MSAITTTPPAAASWLKRLIIGHRLAALLYALTRTSVFLQRPTLLGLATAVVFFCGSLVPGLIPLSWLLQGIISGLWMALGYGLGTSIVVIAGKIIRLELSNVVQTTAWIMLFVAGSSSSAWSLIAAYEWQVDVRQLMGLPTGTLIYPVAVVLVAFVAAMFLVLIARLIRAGYRRYISTMSRYLPRGVAHAVGAITSVILVVFIIDKVVGEIIFPALDRRYRTTDTWYDGSVHPPASPYKSGGAASLVAWETLGVHGRTFVTRGPSTKDLAGFNGKPAMEPIRVYVGRESAKSIAQRADLAVAELERTGAFRRELLVIVNPTGTGWVDPYAVTPLEYMYAGNTAAVAMQYSYLPSWIVMLGNQDVARQTSQALINAVHARLQREPEATRPRLLIYGQSLGAFASESAFTELDDIKQRTDGVLWVGPPSASRLWHEFTARRDASSPLWKPVYNQGKTVRFGFDLKSLAEPTAGWERPRVAYLQHASDPISWWSADMLFRRPAWMEEPVGPDISKNMRYYPIATALRVAVDLMVGLGAPPGHGHNYGVSQAEAWTLIIPPDKWTLNDTQRLITELEAQQ